MTQHNSLIAIVATLIAIVVLVALGVMAAWNGKNIEAIGVGAAVTGLIGVLGTFRPKQTQVGDGQ